MNRNPSPALLLLAFVFVGPATAGGGAAIEWLEKMASAPENVSFEGEVVVIASGQVETMRVWHRVDEHGVRERMISLSGAPREVIRTKDSVKCISSKGGAVLMHKRLGEELFPAIPTSNLEPLAQIYDIEVGGTERVAGHAAQVVTITPKDDARYGYRLSLEHNTGLLLKSEIRDGANNALERVMFSDVQIGTDIPDEKLAAELVVEETVEMEIDADQTLGAESAAPEIVEAVLPPGFRLTAHHRESSDQPDFAMEHFVFSDGIAAISVYIEPASHAPLIEGLASLGAVHFFAHSTDERLLTVVGEVPGETVRALGVAFASADGS